MNDHPRKILCEIILQKGKTFFKETVAFRGLLNDLCVGNYKKERRCIIDSIAEGVPSALLDGNERIPYDILSAQLTNRLINCGFEGQLARWTVDSWAQALGITSPQINTCTLFVVANPPGAHIFLNDKLKGISPLEISSISGGKYDLKFTLIGYETWQKCIEIPEGQKLTINANLIKNETVIKPPSYGEIFINSSPNGAAIFIDSQYHGTTPTKIRDILVGTHEITLNLSGHEKFSKTITIQPGKNADLNEKLRSIESPKTGQITIDSTPSNADIYLDSVYQGKTPHILKGISPGTHSITLKLLGKPPFSTTTIVRQGTNADIFWEFPRPSSKPIPKSIVYASIALISIAVLYFVTGPNLAPFFGFFPILLKSGNISTAATISTTQTPETGGIFLPEGQAISDYLANGDSKTYYFDVNNPNNNIEFIRILLDADPLTSCNFIIGKDYVPTLNPRHFELIQGSGVQTKEVDINNPTSDRYYIVVNNPGNSGNYTISKSIFYKS
jgi:hypothetical protein